MACFQQSDVKINFLRWSGILNHCDTYDPGYIRQYLFCLNKLGNFYRFINMSHLNDGEHLNLEAGKKLWILCSAVLYCASSVLICRALDQHYINSIINLESSFNKKSWYRGSIQSMPGRTLSSLNLISDSNLCSRNTYDINYTKNAWNIRKLMSDSKLKIAKNLIY